MAVSVIIPAYGRASTLTRAIKSVRAQSDTVTEIIVVDDGTPGGLTLAPEQAGDVRILRSDENRGAGTSRNLGARHATYDVLAFLDADDEWLPGSLQPRVSLLTPGACIVGSFIRVDDCRNRKETIQVPNRLETVLETRNPALSSGFVLSRADFDRVGGFPDDRDCAEDWVFLLRLIKGGIRLVPVREPVVAVHVDGRNTTYGAEATIRHALGALRLMEDESLMDPAKLRHARRVVNARVAGYSANAGSLGPTLQYAVAALDGGFDVLVARELLRVPKLAARGIARRTRTRLLAETDGPHPSQHC
jgi:glycosyltransferase involved in cell wall biosynthesis